VDVQEYATMTIFKALKNPACNGMTIKFGVYILGEYGNLIAQKPGMDPEKQFAVVHSKFRTTADNRAKAIILSTYIKFTNLYPQLKPTILNIFERYKSFIDQEIQQRACEYAELVYLNDPSLLSFVCDVMPPYENFKADAPEHDYDSDDNDPPVMSDQLPSLSDANPLSPSLLNESSDSGGRGGSDTEAIPKAAKTPPKIFDNSNAQISKPKILPISAPTPAPPQITSASSDQDESEERRREQEQVLENLRRQQEQITERERQVLEQQRKLSEVNNLREQETKIHSDREERERRKQEKEKRKALRKVEKREEALRKGAERAKEVLTQVHEQKTLEQQQREGQLLALAQALAEKERQLQETQERITQAAAQREQELIEKAKLAEKKLWKEPKQKNRKQKDNW